MTTVRIRKPYTKIMFKKNHALSLWQHVIITNTTVNKFTIRHVCKVYLKHVSAHEPQTAGSVGVAVLPGGRCYGSQDLTFGGERVEIELHLGQIAEVLQTHTNVVCADVEALTDPLREVEDLLPVVEVDTSRRVENKDNIGLSRAFW